MDVFTDATTSVIQVADLFQSVATTSATQAAAASQDWWRHFLGVDWSNPTWDVIILIAFILSVGIFGFALGRERVTALLISTYLSLAITTNLPYLDQFAAWLDGLGLAAGELWSFLILFLVMYIGLSRSQMIQGLAYLGGSWWHVLLLGFFQVGLLTSAILGFLPGAAHDQFSLITRTIFLGEPARFAWLVLPALVLIFLPSSSRRGRRSIFSDID